MEYGLRHYQKFLLIMLWALFIFGCANIAEQQIAKPQDKLRSSVGICAESLNSQLNVSLSDFVAVDAVGIDYFIVLAEQTSIENFGSKQFCHVDKSSLQLVYESVSHSSLTVHKDSKKNESRYRDVYSGSFKIKQASFVKYKLINGIWRHIEERTIPGS